MKNTFQYSKTSPKLVIKNTKKYGKGVFAAEDIKKGEVVYVLGGQRFDGSILLNEVNSNNEDIDDPLQIGKRTYIDLDVNSRCFNHNCDPNAGIRKNTEMIAIKDIKSGEEITFDYSLTIAPTEWRMKCLCGSKKCRRILGDIRTVPAKRRTEYRKLGIIQTYMRKVIKQIDCNAYQIPKYEIEALKKLNKTHNILR